MDEDAGSYTVAVHGRCMIAHSFKGECFGPAQALHGCTYVVDAVVNGPKLLPGAQYLVDICLAESALHDALSCYNERNLDELTEFAGENTTCERFARAVWERVAAALPGPPALTSMRIVVRESDVAFVEYERALLGVGGVPAPLPALYKVSVRGRFMAARSLQGARFGEAQQRLHGGTFIVDALFTGHTLVAGANYLIDICLAEELVAKAIAPLQQTNLNENGGLSREVGNPTASGLARALWTAIARGLPSGHGLRGLKLVVAEHDASIAEFEQSLSGVVADAAVDVVADVAPSPQIKATRGNPGASDEEMPEWLRSASAVLTPQSAVAAASRGAAAPAQPTAVGTSAAGGGRHTLLARGRCMIAHSFKGAEFGPAQALHGCT